MKKFLLSLIFTVAMLYATKAQNSMDGDATIDSLTTSYITVEVANTASLVTIQCQVIKLANGNGTAPAGYMYLEGSNDGVYYAPIKTWKKVNYGVATPTNLWDVDSQTVTSTTASNTAGAAIPKIWTIENYTSPECSYIYIRAKVVLSQGTAAGTGTWKQNRL